MFDQLEEMQLSLDSLSRVNRILKERGNEDIEKGLDAGNLDGDIEFRNVFMKYNKEMILSNLSFIIFILWGITSYIFYKSNFP